MTHPYGACQHQAVCELPKTGVVAEQETHGVTAGPCEELKAK